MFNAMAVLLGVGAIGAYIAVGIKNAYEQERESKRGFNKEQMLRENDWVRARYSKDFK